jgi:two-component system, NarL family, sensor histidine kinase EvgS
MFSSFRYGHLGYWISALVIPIAGAVFHVVNGRAKRSWDQIREARARAEAEDQLRDVIENVPGAVFRLRHFPNGQARFEFVSANVKTVRGVGREALLADAYALTGNVHGEDRARVLQILTAATSLAEPIHHEIRVLDGDGRVRWIETSAQPRREPDGTVLWHGHWTDITEKRALQDALVHAKERAEQATRTKSAFLATMSHEIRTPMNGVLGMLELVTLGPLQQDQRAAIEVVRESSETLLRIIDDILDFSKMEAGKLALCEEPSSLGRIVTRVVELYGAVGAKKGLQLEHSIDAALHEAYLIDTARLQQILSNLASNAVKFTERGTIEIAAKLELRRNDVDIVRLTVRDTGIGIDAGERKRLFAPFTQSGEARYQAAGTGLGLCISRQLVELMGGSIALESELGKGSLVTLLIPMIPTAPPQRPAPQSPHVAPATASSAAPRVLIVDDHPINRLVLDRQVSTLGYAAETAASAEEALERSGDGRFAAILADVNMPGIDGYALARLIRERERREDLRRTIIIACTANAFHDDAEKCIQAGMDDYVAKPVGLAKLCAMLRRWLPRHDSRTALHG